MPLNVPPGAACFVDANVFYYHYVETPGLSAACSELLGRVAGGEVRGATSAHVLAEAVHKVMLAEAAARFGLSRAGLVNWLQHHRARIAELDEFRQAARELAALSMTVLPVDGPAVAAAADASTQLGLLTNDALIVALMRRHEIEHLMTNDDDFDAIAGLTVWKPR